MNENIGYLYRFDNLISHEELRKGGFLRARKWVNDTRHFKHTPLIEVSGTLLHGQNIYRTNYWLEESVMKRYFLSTSDSTPQVAQRVKAAHPFFNKYKKIEDDALRGEALLFYKIELDDADWSQDGLSVEDVEVIDYDGHWKPFVQSKIMAHGYHYEKSDWTKFKDEKGRNVFFKFKYFNLKGVNQLVVVVTADVFDSRSDESLIFDNAIPIFDKYIKIQYPNLQSADQIRMFIFDDVYANASYINSEAFVNSAFVEVDFEIVSPRFMGKFLGQNNQLHPCKEQSYRRFKKETSEYSNLLKEFSVLTLEEVYLANQRLRKHLK